MAILVTEQSKAADVHDEVFAICEKLGIDPSSVGRIVIDPASASITAKVFERNAEGHFFTDPDTNDIALEWRHFKVKT